MKFVIFIVLCVLFPKIGYFLDRPCIGMYDLVLACIKNKRFNTHLRNLVSKSKFRNLRNKRIRDLRTSTSSNRRF